MEEISISESTEKVTTSISVEKIENGYLVSKRTYGYLNKPDKWEEEVKKYYSETNPLEKKPDKSLRKEDLGVSLMNSIGELISFK